MPSPSREGECTSAPLSSPALHLAWVVYFLVLTEIKIPPRSLGDLPGLRQLNKSPNLSWACRCDAGWVREGESQKSVFHQSMRGHFQCLQSIMLITLFRGYKLEWRLSKSLSWLTMRACIFRKLRIFDWDFWVTTYTKTLGTTDGHLLIEEALSSTSTYTASTLNILSFFVR